MNSGVTFWNTLYIGNIIEWHSSSDQQPNFASWYREWIYGTFTLSFSTEGATYIARADITLDIGPHSSIVYFLRLLWKINKIQKGHTSSTCAWVCCMRLLDCGGPPGPDTFALHKHSRSPHSSTTLTTYPYIISIVISN